VAASQSGNVIRLAEAHPVAIAAWRLLMAGSAMALLSGRGLLSLRGLGSRDWLVLGGGAVALTLHFFTWIAAVQWTTVAHAALILAANPVVTSLAAWLLFGEAVSWRLGLAIGLGLAGSLAIAFGDLGAPGSLAGDGMALLSMLLYAAYFLVGRRLRRVLDTRTYVAILYGLGAVLAFACLCALDLPLVAYDDRTWLAFVLMAAVPTLLGHTAINYALGHLPAARVSLLTLMEPVLAGLVAWLAWAEAVGAPALVGYVLIAASVAVAVWPARVNGSGERNRPQR
jgi:drug/metabolite transporter (DMT)-like permease